MKHLLALILILLSFGCLAAIYMQTDSQGNVIYSDTPDNHTQPIVIPPAEPPISIQKQLSESSTSHTSATTEPVSKNSLTTTAGHTNYTTFTIISPTDQQTFQNQRDIPVLIKIDPSLQKGDKVQLYLDGIVAGEPSNDLTQLAVHQVDRGEHQLTAAILDETNHLLNKTETITIYIHYSAIPTGSGAVSPVSFGGNGVTPSSPGSGITTPPRVGSGITPPSQAGSGITPPSPAPAQPGAGVIPPSQFGGGIVPGRP